MFTTRNVLGPLDVVVGLNSCRAHQSDFVFGKNRVVKSASIKYWRGRKNTGCRPVDNRLANDAAAHTHFSISTSHLVVSGEFLNLAI